MADTIVGLIEQANISSNLYNLASTAYGYCETAGGTAAKAVSIPGFKYIEGVTIHVKFRYANTANNPTLNVSSEGAKDIVLSGATVDSVSASNAGTSNETSGWPAGAVLSLTYDGTNWVRDRGYNTNTTYIFDGTYDSGTNKVATVSTITNAINNLDVSNISGFGVGKTLKTLTQTDGKIAATFQDIEIAAGKITSGTLSVARGGTGKDTLTSGQVLIGNGTSAVSTKAIDTTVTANSTNLITSGAVASAISGLTGAMHFVGTATQEITDGGTQHPTTANTTYSGTAGDVVLYSGKEFVWTGSAWELLGDEGSYALDTAVVHKSDYSAAGTILYGTGPGAYSALAGNITTDNKVLVMKGNGTVASAPSWLKLGINPSKTKAVTAVAYTDNTGGWSTLNKGSGVSISGVDSVGTPASATVTNAVLIITNGTAPTKATAVTVPKLSDLSLTGGTWPTLNVTKNTDFLTGASITYT